MILQSAGWRRDACADTKSLVVDVYWARLDEARDDLLGVLDHQERMRLHSMSCPDTALSFLVGRALLRYTMALRQGCRPDSVRVEVPPGSRGKPRLPGTDWEISLSHSGPWVGLAIAKGVPIGLDVEVVDGDWDPLSVAPLVLTPQEQQGLYTIAPASRGWAFTRIWTRKEAVVKATGGGLSRTLTELQVAAPNAEPAVRSWPQGFQAPPPIRLVDLRERAGSLASLAALTPNPLLVAEHVGTTLINPQLTGLLFRRNHHDHFAV